MPGNNPKSVYIVTGSPVPNDRVVKLQALSGGFSKMVFIRPGKDKGRSGTWVVRPRPNVADAFRRLGLHTLGRYADRVYFPSRRVLFVKALQRRLLKAVRADLRAGYEVLVLTCVPPHDLCLLGLTLKRRLPRITWLVDWQDLWSYDQNYLQRVPASRRARLLATERETLLYADMNIATNPKAKAVLESCYGVPPERVVSIPHHYCAADLTGEPGDYRPFNSTPIKLGFMGTLFKPPRVPGEDLYAALKTLRDHGMAVELHSHGMIPAVSREALEDMASDGLIFHGPSNHEQSMGSMPQYDYLIVLLNDLPNCRAVFSIKMAHYLHVGRPIIAIVPGDSTVADIVRATGTGHVIPVEGNWVQGLSTVLQNAHRRDGIQPDYERIREYAWENVSQRWLEVLQHNGWKDGLSGGV